MKKQILNIGTALNRSEQKSITGGNSTPGEEGGDGSVICRCNGFPLGVTESSAACAAACYRCVNSGACAA